MSRPSSRPTEGPGSEARCALCLAQFAPGYDPELPQFHANESHCKLVMEAVEKVVLLKRILRSQKIGLFLPPPLREVPLSNGGSAFYFYDILLGETYRSRILTEHDDRLAKFLRLYKDDPDFAARVALS